MAKKWLLLAVALFGLLPLGGVSIAYAADTAADVPADAQEDAGPPADTGEGNEPDDPDAAPNPPDGVTDPNVTYPTDDSGAGQGDTGAEPPSAPEGEDKQPD